MIIYVKGSDINYIQFSTGEGRHGVPYIKINGNGIKAKIVFGSQNNYIGNITEEMNNNTKFYWIEE